MISFLFKAVFWLLVLLLIAGVVRTWQIQHGAQEKAFLAGTVPSPLPNGTYAGIVPGFHFSWQGKKFNATENTGINVFPDGDRYSFTTSVSKGLLDSSLDVMKIEYNIPSNAWWLRRILDEIVQTAPGKYLGKLELRLIPGYPFALGYFELTK